MTDRRLSDLEKRLVRAAFDQGANHDAIAMLVGRSLTAIQRALHANGCYRHNRRGQPERVTQPRIDSPAAICARAEGRARQRRTVDRPYRGYLAA